MFKKLIILGICSLIMGFIVGSYFFKFLYPQDFESQQANVSDLLNSRKEVDEQIKIHQLESESKDLRQQEVDEIVNLRKSFIDQHLDINTLLKLYEEDEVFLSIKNVTNNFQKINADLFLLTSKRIDQLIDIFPLDANQEKIIKIYDFVKNNSVKTYPLFDYYDDYLSDDLTLSQFFTVYGSGHCSNLAVVFAKLAKEYGFETRVWSFNGHVATEVFYDNEWHFFDPDTLGYFKSKDGKIISLEEVKKLADEGKLKKYNSIIASEEDNEVMLLDNIPLENNEILEELNFYPGERKLFFEKLYLMSSKGRYIIHNGYRQDEEPISYLDEHGKTMANFIRTIPLSNFIDEDYISFNSFFPVVGVFISLPKSFQNISVVPEIKLQSEQIETESWLPGEIVLSSNLNRTYLDFSLALKYLENNPSHEFIIEDIEYLIDKYPQANLLVVNAYSHKNADFNQKNILRLDENFFDINYSATIQ